MLLLFVIVYFLLEILYFRVADYYNIIDKPNHRSSHSVVTIRGGGVIFPLAFIFPGIYIYGHSNMLSFISGLILISLIAFVDDVKPLKNNTRLFIHFIAVALLLFQSGVYENFGVFYLLVFFIIIVGIINAYNFMDGINGIMAMYSIVSVATLSWISQEYMWLADPLIFKSLFSCLLVFLFFNLRYRAKCFAGDIGSVSMAFILAYLVLLLIIKDGDPKWILLFSVFGLDSVCTIIFRLIRKENIFQAHRTHFYQFLTNSKKISHPVVSVVYGIIQLLFNFILITQDIWTSILSFILLCVIYIVLRIQMESSARLFKCYH